jgi:hypothetical protein
MPGIAPVRLPAATIERYFIPVMETTSQTKTCAACAFWNETASNEGECRRQPPQAISFKVDESTQFETRFPVTKASDWCGEFQAK